MPITKRLITIFAEANSKMDKRNRITHTKYEVQQKERLDILDNAGDQALLLYEFYLRMAAIPDATMEDSDVRRYFKWDLQKVARNRRALEKLNYFRKITYTSSNGRRSVTYYLTKDRVEKL